MSALVVALLGATGVHLLWTSLVDGRRSLVARNPTAHRRPTASRAPRWLHQAGLRDVRWREFGAVCLAVAIGAFLLTYAIFGGLVPAALAASCCGAYPLFAFRHRRLRRLAYHCIHSEASSAISARSTWRLPSRSAPPQAGTSGHSLESH